MSDKKPTDAAEESTQSEEKNETTANPSPSGGVEHTDTEQSSATPISDSEVQPQENAAAASEPSNAASASSSINDVVEPEVAPVDVAPIDEPAPAATGSKAQASANQRENTRNTKTAPSKTKSRTALWFMLFMVLVVFGALGYGAYYADQWLKNRDAETQALLEQLKQQQTLQSQNLNAIAQSQSRFGDADKTLAAQLQQSEQRLAAAEKRLALQNKRLLSMSTTSRDDWLLAEAQYLLKLANQRILIERSAAGADALLSEADGILRDLGDPDLFPLRQALAKDLAKVRLVEKIDLEGMYLQLQALSNSVEQLPVKPTWDQLADNGEIESLIASDEAADVESKDAVSTEQTQGEGMAQKLWSKTVEGFGSFTGKMDDYIRVRHHDIAPEPMMSPQATMYLQQNLRLVLERAQLALLREQPEIYVSSLAQATLWLKKYYPNTQSRQAFVAQLDQLAATPIVQNLPDISPSLELLHTYIAELHQLKGVDSSAGGSQ